VGFCSSSTSQFSIFVDRHSHLPSSMTRPILKSAQHWHDRCSVQTTKCSTFQQPQVHMPFHANCSVMHRTSLYHFPLHALQCYPLYRSVHKHCHICYYPCLVRCYEKMSIFSVILVAVIDTVYEKHNHAHCDTVTAHHYSSVTPSFRLLRSSPLGHVYSDPSVFPMISCIPGSSQMCMCR